MRSSRIAMGTLAAVGFGAWLWSCGDDSNGIGPSDASPSDAGRDSTVIEAAAGDDAGEPGDANVPLGDAGACAPPSDPTKAALCLSISIEPVQFLPSVPGFDGKGALLVAIQSSAMPDGGPTVVAPLVLPDLDAGSDAGVVDISKQLPIIRVDDIPAATVYPQVLFIDDPGAGLKTPVPGWWLGNYDFSNGLQGAPLRPVALQAGQSATLNVVLRPLRALVLNVSTAVAPAGNGQGPLKVIVIEGNSVAPDSGARAWGFGSSPCVDCVGDAGKLLAFFVGSGPYYTVPVLDDFGLGGDFPPGAMTSLDPDAGLTVPAANQFTAGNAYVYSQAVQLNYVAPPPDGGIDEASCP